jgi:hypothetical protein
MEDSNLEFAKDALNLLTADEVEEFLPYFNAVLKLKRYEKTMKIMSTLKKGDKVKLTNVKPAFNNGAVGVVVCKKETKVRCTFPGTSWEHGVTVPASCLIKVD